MRPDKAKGIVERPRFGSRMRGGPCKGRSRQDQKFGIDRVRGEGIKKPYVRRKNFNEHLGPLRRYLESQVGRPWDDVFAEICRYIDRGSAVQDHVRDHVEQY